MLIHIRPKTMVLYGTDFGKVDNHSLRGLWIQLFSEHYRSTDLLYNRQKDITDYVHTCTNHYMYIHTLDSRSGLAPASSSCATTSE